MASETTIPEFDSSKASMITPAMSDHDIEKMEIYTSVNDERPADRSRMFEAFLGEIRSIIEKEKDTLSFNFELFAKPGARALSKASITLINKATHHETYLKDWPKPAQGVVIDNCRHMLRQGKTKEKYQHSIALLSNMISNLKDEAQYIDVTMREEQIHSLDELMKAKLLLSAYCAIENSVQELSTVGSQIEVDKMAFPFR